MKEIAQVWSNYLDYTKLVGTQHMKEKLNEYVLLQKQTYEIAASRLI